MSEEAYYRCENGPTGYECEVCWPASELRFYEGKTHCEGCWDSAGPVFPEGSEDPLRWLDLPRFVPMSEARIATLEAELREVKGEKDRLFSALAVADVENEELQAKHTALVERADRFESLLRRYMNAPVPCYTRGKVTELVDGEIHGRLAMDIADAFKKHRIPLDE